MDQVKKIINEKHQLLKRLADGLAMLEVGEVVLPNGAHVVGVAGDSHVWVFDMDTWFDDDPFSLTFQNDEGESISIRKEHGCGYAACAIGSAGVILGDDNPIDMNRLGRIDSFRYVARQFGLSIESAYRMFDADAYAHQPFPIDVARRIYECMGWGEIGGAL